MKTFIIGIITLSFSSVAFADWFAPRSGLVYLKSETNDSTLFINKNGAVGILLDTEVYCSKLGHGLNSPEDIGNLDINGNPVKMSAQCVGDKFAIIPNESRGGSYLSDIILKGKNIYIKRNNKALDVFVNRGLEEAKETAQGKIKHKGWTRSSDGFVLQSQGAPYEILMPFPTEKYFPYLGGPLIRVERSMECMAGNYPTSPTSFEAARVFPSININGKKIRANAVCNDGSLYIYAANVNGVSEFNKILKESSVINITAVNNKNITFYNLNMKAATTAIDEASNGI